ncbi:unnamed protein product, partial [Prunus brigantina]
IQVILILLPLKEQKQGDAPTEGNNVGTECVMDYSDQFTTYSIFNSRDALLRWAHEQGKLNNIVIVIKRSDYGGEGKRRPHVILACERNGNYKSCKSSETTDIRSDAIREHKRYNEIERALNYFDDGFAPFFCWMTMPDMEHIIATCYNVHLSPDHPIPPVSRMWHEQSDICNVTHLYSRYQARVDAFQQLPGVENVATTDTVILMTDENAPVTELRL